MIKARKVELAFRAFLMELFSRYFTEIDLQETHR